MGKSQRDKGAAYEREVAIELTKQLGVVFKRVLGQARDGGGDVESVYMDVLFECKRRKTLKGLYQWMRQAVMSSQVQSIMTGRRSIPALVFRADGEKSIVAFHLTDLGEAIAEMMGDA